MAPFCTRVSNEWIKSVHMVHKCIERWLYHGINIAWWLNFRKLKLKQFWGTTKMQHKWEAQDDFCLWFCFVRLHIEIALGELVFFLVLLGFSTNKLQNLFLAHKCFFYFFCFHFKVFFYTVWLWWGHMGTLKSIFFLSYSNKYI